MGFFKDDAPRTKFKGGNGIVTFAVATPGYWDEVTMRFALRIRLVSRDNKYIADSAYYVSDILLGPRVVCGMYQDFEAKRRGSGLQSVNFSFPYERVCRAIDVAQTTAARFAQSSPNMRVFFFRICKSLGIESPDERLTPEDWLQALEKANTDYVSK